MKNLVGFIFVLMLSVPLALAFVNVGGDSGTVDVGGGSGGTVVVGNPSYCGNNNIDQGEQCDGSNFGGATCSSQGYDAGDLSCSSGCIFDVGACYDNPSDAGGDTGSGGGGSGGGGSCDANWVCTEWGECNDGNQERECTTVCGLDSNKPAASRSCSVEGESGDAGVGLDDDSGAFTSLFTGAFLGQSGQVWAGMGMFALIIILAVVAYWFYNRD